MSSWGCWLGLPLLLTAVAGGLGGPGSRETAPHRVKRGFTYPGTLWCGAGSNAESYEQLGTRGLGEGGRARPGGASSSPALLLPGEYEETDRCCREHDQCQHVIDPFAVGYGHHNFRWHTVSHCDCDTRLKECLRQAKDAASRAVGQAFFNVIQAPCFELAYEEGCVERYWYGWCKSYGRVPRAVLRDPILYEFGGELLHAPSPTSPPAGRPSQHAPAGPRARNDEAAKKGRKKKRKKRKRKRKRGSAPTRGPGPRLAMELESRTPAAPHWGGHAAASFNDVLHHEPKAEEPTEVRTAGRPKRGRRKGHGRTEGHGRKAEPPRRTGGRSASGQRPAPA
ncbi:protein PROCA1 [Gracilinanus agilis]|uniref:protein PROCA1 n=1 Tax=Gracilinanus agilis TaxID=191870 RepID=UPI001CFE4FA2|nr:protein PROCA1 [Gracilinanus agilis]